MRERSGISKIKILIACCFTFIAIAIFTFLGVQFFTKTGLFRIPGVVTYGDKLTDEELEKYGKIFSSSTRLNSNLNISAENYLELPELKEGEFLDKIIVPTADFYSDLTNVGLEYADQAFSNCLDCGYQLTNINELDFSRKLLSINNSYYLDDFKAGAIFRVIRFDSEKYAEEIHALISGLFSDEWMGKENVLSFAQTGVTALSRGMNRKLREVGDANYFAEKIGKYLSGFDLTHTSNESSFSNYASDRNICSSPSFLNTLTAVGLDIVELSGNHNVDCGDDAAASSIDTYLANGIRIVGGGKTSSEAAAPLNISLKNNNITMLAFNQSTGGATNDNTPGANQYIEETAANQIKEAKTRGDFVVVDVQYYECNAYASTDEDPTCDFANSSAGDQIGFFRHLIDLGADLVVGTSAHQPQTFELYGNGLIYYGLGNLFFDQVWWPGTTRSLIIANYYYNSKLIQSRVVPTVYHEDMQTTLMDEETSRWFLNRLKTARP